VGHEGGKKQGNSNDDFLHGCLSESLIPRNFPVVYQKSAACNRELRAVRSRLALSNNVVIVGGGMAGLAASIYLARGGRIVTLFEKRPYLGGRAVTHLRHGYRFNLGPHAFYRGGEGSKVLAELGIPVRGGVPKQTGMALYGTERHKLPAGIWSLWTTGLLNSADKWEASRLLMLIRRLKNPAQFAAMSARQWLDANITRSRVRETIEALLRLATYCNSMEMINAGAALNQLRLAMRGVIYVDEGWQKIVDALHSSAVAAGVNFVTSSRVVRVKHDGGVQAIEIGGLEFERQSETLSYLRPMPGETHGTPLASDSILLAVDPSTARELIGEVSWPPMTPVIASTLDVALSRLPQPKKTFALGIDRPLYFSVHSRWAQLTPKGGALIHVTRYGGGDQAELEALLDEMQPEWRDLVVHCRFLPSMTVSNAVMPPAPAVRPAAVTPIRGLYLAGDWVGDKGLLSDAALASARDAAKAMLTTS
jgi:phytoene dehydrogenase-like protein